MIDIIQTVAPPGTGLRIVMTKVKKDRAELEAMVLAELRQVPQCEDARSVTVIGLDDEAGQSSSGLPRSFD